jgi:hypothetical protein
MEGGVFLVCTTSVVAKNTMSGSREYDISDRQPVSHWLPEIVHCVHSVYAPPWIRFDGGGLAAQDADIPRQCVGQASFPPR